VIWSFVAGLHAYAMKKFTTYIYIIRQNLIVYLDIDQDLIEVP